MPDPARSHLDDQVARYARRELSPEEARQLAQQSLDDPELFEELTASALVQSTLENPQVRAEFHAGLPQTAAVRPRLVRRIWIPVSLAAAASLAIAFYAVRRPNLTPEVARQSAGVARIQPVLESLGSPGQPILLATGFTSAASSVPPEVFRSAEANARAPKHAGRIVSVEGGIASIDLGALDGLAAGDEIRILRRGQSIGRLTVTAVFRESARGRVAAGDGVRAEDEVRPADRAYLQALADRVDSLLRRGNAEAARSEAESALPWAQGAGVVSAERANLLRRAADLEARTGLGEAAEKHYREALEILRETPPARDSDWSGALNGLAVLYLMRGDAQSAEAPLREALAHSSKPDAAHARIVNNLAVLAEWRGDRQQAAALYTQALNALAPAAEFAAERRLVETNLARMTSPH